jgi:hypothetical protein
MGHTAPALGEARQLRKGQVFGFLIRSHLGKAGLADDAAEKSILPFDVEFSADFAVVCFLAFEGPQILVWLIAVAGLDPLEIKP